MARHMEHPGSLQSNPASMRILSRPSSSAWCLTRPEPGTTMAWTPSATLRPLAMAETSLMSSMRPLVQDPMNTFSIGSPLISCPPLRPMYSRERVTAAFRASSCPGASIMGTFPSTGTASWGDVPQVTVGAMSLASMTTVLSYAAPSSDVRLLQYSTALSHCSPEGHMGRPLRYPKVTSSGAMTPARAPASMAMLEMDMRASMLRDSMAEPANSMVQPVPPAVPMTPQM
mmetsp:Transcript_25062/g.51056  ORF Transcript_25062/g.51056 Transcript_25062/m.51056 type:complete len:229 (+) Transcript_25062:1564-2250(+)